MSSTLIPIVSIVTPTYKNRIKFIPLMMKNVSKQLYQHDRLEWIVVGDDKQETKDAFELRAFPTLREMGIICKYFKCDILDNIGDKRNFCVSMVTSEIIANMDDDDIYNQNYINESIRTMKEKKATIVGCRDMLIFYPNVGQKMIYIRGTKIHEGTMCFQKKHWQKYKFKSAIHAEGVTMVKGKFFNEVDIKNVMTCISHNENTFDKSGLLTCAEVELNDSQRETIMNELKPIGF